MNFRSRQPLTAVELARRAAVLSANQPKSLNGSEAELTANDVESSLELRDTRHEREDDRPAALVQDVLNERAQ